MHSHIILLWFQLGDSSSSYQVLLRDFSSTIGWDFGKKTAEFSKSSHSLFWGMASKNEKGKKKRKVAPIMSTHTLSLNAHLTTLAKVMKKFEELCLQFPWYFKMNAYDKLADIKPRTCWSIKNTEQKFWLKIQLEVGVAIFSFLY